MHIHEHYYDPFTSSFEISCTVFFNGCVHHVGVCPLPRSEEIIRFPRSAADGDQSSTWDTDASVRTKQGAGAEALQSYYALAFTLLHSHLLVHICFRGLRCPWRARKAPLTSSSVQKTARVPAVPLLGAAQLNLQTPPWYQNSPLTNQKPELQRPR